MGNYSVLKAAIESVIKTNGNNEITGQLLQTALVVMIEELGSKYQFAGIATPGSTGTNPGTPDYNVMYLAGVGTYPNFGGTDVEKGHIGVFAYNGSWDYAVIETGAYFEYEEYPQGAAIEFTFYDSEKPDGVSFKINKDVSGISNAPDEAISQWWAAQMKWKLQDIQGYTDTFPSLSTSVQSLGLFGVIKNGKVIDSITGANKLIFVAEDTTEYVVTPFDLPYKALADLVSVKLESGTASNVSIHVRGEMDILISHININEIANHPDAYANAAAALNDVPLLYRRKGMKVVYYDDDTQLQIEMLCIDDFGGANWWTDVENNWVIEGPIETKIPTATGGQQLRIAGEKRGNLDDVLNVNVWNGQIYEYATQSGARAAVPANKRKLGAIITYLVSTGTDTSGWMIDEFIGSSISDWTVAGNWKTIGPITIPDKLEITGGDILANVGKIPLRNAVYDETFGLKFGYYEIDGTGWNNSHTRATTKLINSKYKPIKIKTTGNIRIAGVFQFDWDYNQLQYISIDSDSYYTQKGYYYAITFKRIQGGDIDLEEVLDNIYIGYTETRIVKLAKWGSAGNPTDLNVGDIYTPDGTELVRVDEIIDGVVTEYSSMPFSDGTIYICNNKLYTYNGTTLIEPLAIDRSKVVYSESDFFGNTLGLLNSGDGSTTKIRDFIQNDIYGLKQGYFISGYNDDASRVSTKLLDGIVTPIDVKITNPVFAIAGYMKFDADYSFIEYINSGFDAHHITLPAGYIYEITLKRNSGGNLTPSDIAPYIVINDRLRIYELEKTTTQLVNTDFDIAALAEAKTWYVGQTIGDTLTSETISGCYAVKQAVMPGEIYRLTAKGASGGRGWYLLDADNKIVDLSGVNFNNTIDITIPNGVAYLLIQSNDGLSHLALTRYGQIEILQVRVEELETSVENIETDITNLKNMADSFKCLTPFVWNKLSRMKNQESGFCNIGFIGDSWTQGTENIVDGVQSGYAGYVEPLTKLLQDEYGFGGLGWLDFARDGGANKMFGCVDLYKRWTYQFSGTVTGLDGHNDQQAPNCLGICCAHTIFSNGASLTLGFDANILDVFKLRYYKNAHFNVSVNGGAPVEVTANANDGWQETTFGTTGTNITSVVITSLADNTIIFGMDCFFGTKGVRCHKIGNRSIEASDYLLMNAEQWETGISMLNLCWCSVLLAINDLGGSTSETRMNTIVTNISNLINRLKVATDDGNGLVTCDINVLGVENIENSGWTGLGALAKKQKAMALANGYGWCSTDKCIGSKKAEFIYNGTFSDQIHLNKIGSYAYAKHIYDTLFDF